MLKDLQYFEQNKKQHLYRYILTVKGGLMNDGER